MYHILETLNEGQYIAPNQLKQRVSIKNNKIIYVMIFEEGDKNQSGGVFNKSSAIPDEYLPKELLEYKNK